MKKVLISLLFAIPVFSGARQVDSTIKENPACPVCKAHDKVIPIVYGKPGRETMEKAEKGQLWLGGCVVDEKSPKYYCKRDKKEF